MKKWAADAGRRIGRDLKDYKEVLVVFAVYYVFMHVVFHAFCPLVLVTGLPCAGCGMTRAVFFLLTGQFERSFRLHPMALPVLLFAGYCAVRRWLLGKRVKGFQAGLLLLCAGMLAVWVYRMITVFPNHAPFSYTSGSLLERIVPAYKEILHRLFGL